MFFADAKKHTLPIIIELSVFVNPYFSVSGDLLYEYEIFCPLETGMEMKAFVKQVREDGKVDLILQKPGFDKIDDFSKTLLDYIKAQWGRINLNDNSPAEDIYDTFGVS